MAVTSGFYNSVSGDRKYNALQMSSIFDGIIEDGVYNSIGDRFSLTAGEGNTVIVGTGRAWFNHTWTLNDADYPLTIEPAEVVLNRYDAIVIEVNGSNAVRNNSIKVIKGTAGSSPSKPTMANGDDNIWQHPLGYIYVPAGSSSVSQSNIEYVVGTSECPFVIAAVQSVDIDALLAQWDDAFNTWFDNLETQLSGDVAGNLQNQINQKVDKANVIDDPDELMLVEEEGFVAGAKATAALLAKKVEFVEHFSITHDIYGYDCYILKIGEEKHAIIYGSATVRDINGTTLAGGLYYGNITNIRLTPNDKRIYVLSHKNLQFHPGTGGGGLFFTGNYEGLSASEGSVTRRSSVKSMSYFITSPPRTVKLYWTMDVLIQ